MVTTRLTLALTLLSALSSLPTEPPNVTSYDILQLDNTTSFIEIMGEAVMATDSWTVFANITMEDHQEAIEYLQNLVSAITALHHTLSTHDGALNLTAFNNNCYATIKTLRDTIKTSKYIRMKKLGLIGKIRIQRALEFVGAFDRWAFGSMDAEDRKEISHQLINLARHENSTFHLLHKQITITRSALEGIKTQLLKLGNEVDNLKEEISTVSR